MSYLMKILYLMLYSKCFIPLGRRSMEHVIKNDHFDYQELKYENE